MQLEKRAWDLGPNNIDRIADNTTQQIPGRNRACEEDASQRQSALDFGAGPSRCPRVKAAGWKLGQVTTDKGSGFASSAFGGACETVGARQWRIKAGNPNSNGCVERAQLTILEECWRPAFARSLAPKITALRRDLAEYLDEFNYHRPHNGCLTQGRVPADVVFRARKLGTVR